MHDLDRSTLELTSDSEEASLNELDEFPEIQDPEIYGEAEPGLSGELYGEQDPELYEVDGLEVADEATYGEESSEMYGEQDPELYGEGSESYGEQDEAELYGEVDQETGLSDNEVTELASELLEVTSDAELDHFLGKLFKKVGRIAGKVISSPVGQQLKGILRNAARKALPLVGTAVGGVFGGPLGASIGGKLAATAGSAFGLELEGLSGQDQHFEIARQYVRLAGAAARQAARAPLATPPRVAVQRAFNSAAQRFAPGLVGSAIGGRRPRQGRWFRKRGYIVLVGA